MVTPRYSVGRQILSATLLAVLVLGVPAALVAFAGNPLPSGVPSFGEARRALTSPDDGTLFLGALVVLAWAAWAVFTLLVVLEIPAQLTGRRAVRLPGLGGAQGGARWLVAPLLSLVALTGVGTAASATDAPSATATVDQQNQGVSVVEGDTLWDLAQEHLGDGARWDEIYQLNRDSISDKDLILPGQQLVMPGGKTIVVAPGHTTDTTGPSPQQETAPTPATDDTPADRTGLGPVGQGKDAATPESFLAGTDSGTSTPADQADAPHASTSGTATTSGGVSQARDATASPRPQVVSAPAADPSPQAAGDSAAEETDQDTITGQNLLGISSLGAVGLVGIIGAARAVQRRRRKPGERVVMPQQDTAALESDLVKSADPIGAEDLDRALRTLAVVTADAGQDLPGLRAARLTTTHVELYCAGSVPRLPDPFETVDNVDGVFLLDRERISDLLDPHTAAQVPAPYPALFTLGSDEEGAWVLLNLEQVGSLGLDGPEEECRAILAAAALELIASTWSDDLRVTLVGDLKDLAHAMAHDRVDYATSVQQILAPVTYAAAAHGRNLTNSGATDVTHARGFGVADETWTPHLILLGTEPTPDERDALAALVTSTPRVAIATITTHTEPLTDWVLQMTEGPQAVLHPVGMEMAVQKVHPAQYNDLVDLLGLAHQPSAPGPQWTTTLDDTQVIPTTTTGPGDPTALPILTGPEETPAEDTEQVIAPSATSATADVMDLNDLPAPQEDGTTDQDDPTGPQGNPEEAPAPDEDTQTDLEDDAGQDREEAPATVLPTDGPLIRLLGTVEILEATGKRPRSPGIAAEALAFLALHPTQDRDELDAALWPDSTPAASTRAARLSQARSWLGNDHDGHPHVPLVDDAGGYQVDGVRVDWHQMLTLIGEDITSTSTADLEQALALVDGPPLSGVNPKRYGWARADREEMTAAIGDIATTLAHRHLPTNPTAATTALDTALTVDPTNEALWRYKLLAADHLGQADSVMTDMTTALENVDGDLDPETIALMEQIAHTDRRAST